MKKYKLKNKVREFIEMFLITLGTTLFVFTCLSLLSWRVKQYDEKVLEQEYKKTEMSRIQLSQNEFNK